MSVYVDELRQHPPAAHASPAARRVGKLHGYWWCHLVADTRAELVAFAETIGMRARWVQGDDRRGYHFDLVPPRRAAAVARGAVEVDARRLIEVLKKTRAPEPMQGRLW
jgi:hypothetical protein